MGDSTPCYASLRNFSRTCFISMFGLVIGCGGDPGANDDGGGDVDAGVDQPVCTGDTQCGGDTPFCVDNNCAQCRTSADCPSGLPVCGNGQCTASCTGDELQANFVSIPSDIIWVVDQSGSMDQETAYVQSKINDFAASISASSIDYRVVMIASTSGDNSICVPAPLSNGSCGNHTRFRLVNQEIDSHDGPSRTIQRYNLYSDFLRAEAMKHFVFVTDDNSSMTAQNFKNGIANLMPTGMFANYKVHAIYAYGNGMNNGCTGSFGNGAAVGTVYTTLVTDTGGARGVICNDDWTQVFNDIGAAVVSGSQVECEIDVPAPPPGQTLDPTKVNVKYVSGGVAGGGVTLPQVPNAGACGTGGGWYYDDNTAPTKITLCPATCTQVQGDPSANVKLELGCSTQIL